MDFAKRQLERMGWKQGKGLGLKEDGITKAIKPDVQLNSRGLGFTVADSIQIKNQWWSEAYNSAINGTKHDYKITSVGVIVKPKSSDDTNADKKGRFGSRFKSAGFLERYEDKLLEEEQCQKQQEEEEEDDNVELIKKKKKKDKKKNKNRNMSENNHEDDDQIERTKIEVIKVEMITEDGCKSYEATEKTQKKKKKDKKRKLDDSNDDTAQLITNDDTHHQHEPDTKKSKKLKHIDFNEIFKMSEGVTCHKAARHGINMTGKMKRLQEQEAEFLRKLKAK